MVARTASSVRGLVYVVFAMFTTYYSFLVLTSLYINQHSPPSILRLTATTTTTTHHKSEIVVAYCVYPQDMRPGEPVSGSEYLAKTLGPLTFPSNKYELVIKTCLAVPEQLPVDISPMSVEGLTMLGLYGVHLRFCSFGSSALLGSTFARMGTQIKLKPFDVDLNSAALQRVLQSGVTAQRLDNIQVFVNPENDKVIGPLLTRASREPHVEYSLGVPLQFETKATKHANSNFALLMPYAYESFGRSRWNGNDPKRVFEHHQERFGKNDMFTLRESVTRTMMQQDTNNSNNKGFMAMVNSNCRRIPTSHIRSVFGYAVFNRLRKPVHNLGFCPLDPRGSTLAGITPQERMTLKKNYRSGQKGAGASVSDIFQNYKFSVCFENSNVDGYASEKMVTPYVARSIPVYWGSGTYLNKIFNPKAFVHCNLPTELTQRVNNDFFSFCKLGLRPKLENELTDMPAIECAEDGILEALMPYFDPCIAQIEYLDTNNTAYEEMLNEPLATVDAKTGELTGYWDESNYANAIKAVFDFMRYETGPQELKQALGVKN